MKNNILALVAAVVGGVVGHFAFLWITRQGFYAVVLPGAFVGLAASHFKSRAIGVSLACGGLALGLGLFSEWRYAPFVKDPGFVFFVTHAHLLPPIKLIMIAIGTVMGFWFPFSHRHDRAIRAESNG